PCVSPKEGVFPFLDSLESIAKELIRSVEVPGPLAGPDEGLRRPRTITEVQELRKQGHGVLEPAHGYIIHGQPLYGHKAGGDRLAMDCALSVKYLVVQAQAKVLLASRLIGLGDACHDRVCLGVVGAECRLSALQPPLLEGNRLPMPAYKFVGCGQA